MNDIHAKVLAASVQGIRANPKMRSVTPETLARYAIEDADAVVRALGAAPKPAAEREHLKELQERLGHAQRQVSDLSSRLAAILWAQPDNTVVLSDAHTKLLGGRGWEIKQVPIADGVAALTLKVHAPAPPPTDAAPVVPEVQKAAEDTVRNRPHPVPADLSIVEHADEGEDS